MMLTDYQFHHLCTFVGQYLEETAATSEQEWVRDFPRTAEHRWQHTLNVLRNAERILAGEGAADDVADVVRVRRRSARRLHVHLRPLHPWPRQR